MFSLISPSIIPLLTAPSCFCTQLYPLFKILPARQISPVYGIHPFKDRCHQRRNKRKKKKGTGKSLLCVLIPVSWDGLSWEDCVGLRPGTHRILTPQGGKRNGFAHKDAKTGTQTGINQVMEERCSICLKCCMWEGERRTSNGEQGKSDRIHRLVRRGRQL